MDGARVTLRTDAELERPPGAARRAVAVSHRSLGDGIFMHPSQHIIPFYSKIFIVLIIV